MCCWIWGNDVSEKSFVYQCVIEKKVVPLQRNFNYGKR